MEATFQMHNQINSCTKGCRKCSTCSTCSYDTSVNDISGVSIMTVKKAEDWPKHNILLKYISTLVSSSCPHINAEDCDCDKIFVEGIELNQENETVKGFIVGASKDDINPSTTSWCCWHYRFSSQCLFCKVTEGYQENQIALRMSDFR